MPRLAQQRLTEVEAAAPKAESHVPGCWHLLKPVLRLTAACFLPPYTLPA